MKYIKFLVEIYALVEQFFFKTIAAHEKCINLQFYFVYFWHTIFLFCWLQWNIYLKIVNNKSDFGVAVPMI